MTCSVNQPSGAPASAMMSGHRHLPMAMVQNDDDRDAGRADRRQQDQDNEEYPLVFDGGAHLQFLACLVDEERDQKQIDGEEGVARGDQPERPGEAAP